VSRARARSVAFASCALLVAGLSTAQELPTPAGAINDFAGVLSPDTEAELSTLVAGVEKSTSAEIAVATVSSLGGTTIDDYAVQLFKAWGVGQRTRDNGVLVLVAPTERAIRIEVGYGLEGVLPDGLAGAVVRDTFLPRFREGDFDGGVRQGVTRLAEIIRRHETLTPEQLRALEQGGTDWMPFVFVPFLGLFVAIGMGVLGSGLRHADSFFLIFGSAFGGLPLLASAAFGLYGFLILLILALVALAVGYFLGAAIVGRLQHSGGSSGSTGSARRSSSGSSSRSSSSSSSSRSSGSSSSSGGFGGGRSGGGGASGSW
jgi:uncharacterized protein